MRFEQTEHREILKAVWVQKHLQIELLHLQMHVELVDLVRFVGLSRNFSIF